MLSQIALCEIVFSPIMQSFSIPLSPSQCLLTSLVSHGLQVRYVLSITLSRPAVCATPKYDQTPIAQPVCGFSLHQFFNMNYFCLLLFCTSCTALLFIYWLLLLFFLIWISDGQSGSPDRELELPAAPATDGPDHGCVRAGSAPPAAGLQGGVPAGPLQEGNDRCHRQV